MRGFLGLLASVPLTCRQSLCAGVRGSSVGTGSRGYGLMFQAGHLGASLRRPGDPGAEGLSPWADKALQNGGRGGCGPGSRAQAGVAGVEDGAQRGSGTCGDERLARQTEVAGAGLLQRADRPPGQATRTDTAAQGGGTECRRARLTGVSASQGSRGPDPGCLGAPPGLEGPALASCRPPAATSGIRPSLLGFPLLDSGD